MCKQNPCQCFTKHHCKDWAFLILRLALGAILTYHGYEKLFGQMPSMSMFAGMVGKLGFPMPTFFAYASALTEFVGGLAMIFGIFARIFGILIVIDMLVAFIGAHNARLGLGDASLSLLAAALAIVLAGPGRFSLGCRVCRGTNCCKDTSSGSDCCDHNAAEDKKK